MRSEDLDLLRAFAQGSDDAAFAQLVGRHGAWIFAAARRRLRDDHLADDATQAVFIVLADKASQLIESKKSLLSAWLFHVMHLTCGRLRRTRSRKKRHESGAAVARQTESRLLPDDNLRILLEDAIAQLPPIDREAVVRRFYENQDFATIGKALRITAEAARKRVSRAIATVRQCMLLDGIDVIPDELLGADERRIMRQKQSARIRSIAKGTMTMIQQSEAIDFAVISAEFFVNDVETNLDFFEKLGFRRHFIDVPDAMGRVPRASLRGGKAARIWLRRADPAEGTRPTPGMSLFFWINGGADSLAAHRKSIAAQGVRVSAFVDDVTLRNFTVSSPDGYSIGFFTMYK